MKTFSTLLTPCALNPQVTSGPPLIEGQWWGALIHIDVMTWKHFPRYSAFVRGIHRSPVNSPHKGQWRGALMFCLICVWINDWVHNHEAGDLRRHRAHHDVIVMQCFVCCHFVEGNSRVACGLSRHDAIVTSLLYSKSGLNGKRGQNGTPGV